MASLAEVWSVLRAVRSLRFDARGGTATGWHGTGVGTVAVSQPGAGVVVFEEAGTWQPAVTGRPAVRFGNVFRWTAVGDAIRLEHLRHGPDRPVLLFDLAPGDDGEWRPVNLHQCREDSYTASLTVEGQMLVVAWSVQGPRKQEFIRYVYRP